MQCVFCFMKNWKVFCFFSGVKGEVGELLVKERGAMTAGIFSRNIIFYFGLVFRLDSSVTLS